MRIGSYNMLGFQGWPETVAAQSLGPADSSERLAHFAAVIQELDCDIVGVQEGGSVDWLERLAGAVGVNAACFPSPTAYPGAIITRHPIIKQHDFSGGLAPSGTIFSRTAGAALLDVAGRPLWVLNIHAHPKIQDLRDAEAEVLGLQVDTLLQTSPDMIVMGDFNSKTGTIIHEALGQRGFMNTMELAGRGEAFTMTNLQGVGRLAIDHIYVSPSLVQRVLSSWVVSDPGFRMPAEAAPETWVHSDHLPIVAELEW